MNRQHIAIRHGFKHAYSRIFLSLFSDAPLGPLTSSWSFFQTLLGLRRTQCFKSAPPPSISNTRGALSSILLSQMPFWGFTSLKTHRQSSIFQRTYLKSTSSRALLSPLSFARINISTNATRIELKASFKQRSFYL